MDHQFTYVELENLLNSADLVGSQIDRTLAYQGGRIKDVEMKDVDKSRDLAKKYDLLVVEAYPEVKTVIFKGRYPSQVLESIRQLQSEPTVSRAEIEVLENLKVPL